MRMRAVAAAALLAGALGLGGCQDGTFGGGGSTRHLTPIPPKTLSLMQTKGMSQGDPILIRAYKKEAEMEVWKRGASGQYALLKTFPICRWSGQLGPKTKQGDRQAPEGFYTITPGQMNPNSAYYLSFDTGYPNAYDRANGRSGNYIMVHGTCSSAGCFAMTDESMAEIYSIAREAFAGGQRAFQFQSYPFRMTAQNVAKFRNDPNTPFWRNLKEGSDYFEALREEPRVGLCGNRYVFGGADAAAGSCNPRVEPQVAEKRERDNREIAELVGKGTAATRVVYEDGGQNPVFRPQAPTNAFANLAGPSEAELPYTPKDYARHALGDVSRPEGLATGPQEVEVDAKGRPVVSQPVMTASIEAPIPTKAAAAALGRRNGRAGETVKAPPMLAKGPEAEPPVAQKAPGPRIAVADADPDSPAYAKLLGSVFGQDGSKEGSRTPPPSTPAVEAATTAAIVPPAPPLRASLRTTHAATSVKPTIKGEAKATSPAPALRGSGEPADTAIKPGTTAKPALAKPTLANTTTAKPTTAARSAGTKTAAAAPKE